ncbi:MAG: hypothetical protein K0U98_21375 [Deltaproteobacteria bacterium]|nr:hypothetical protein [Deltaproteobacteria bacterium]
MARNSYEINYARLEALMGQPLPSLRFETVFRLRASGFMDLTVERLPDCFETGGIVLSLAHYFVQNGDLCQDPEMTVRLFPPGLAIFQQLAPSTDLTLGRVEALSFQQASPPIYQRVYPQPGSYYRSLRRDLNSFLGLWLRNLEDQSHRPFEPDWVPDPAPPL